MAIWNDLAAVRNPFRIPALEELAKHYEHRQKDLARALETTRAALDHMQRTRKTLPRFAAANNAWSSAWKRRNSG